MILPEKSHATVASAASRVVSRRSSGFTLLELMIVLAIIGILASIAYASFQRNILETRRKAATACLQEGAQFMERWYTTRLTYAGADPAPSCETSLAIFYTFPPPPVATASAYTLTAVPKNQQLRDTKCGTLGINQTGTRTKTGTAGSVGDCW